MHINISQNIKRAQTFILLFLCLPTSNTYSAPMKQQQEGCLLNLVTNKKYLHVENLCVYVSLIHACLRCFGSGSAVLPIGEADFTEHKSLRRKMEIGTVILKPSHKNMPKASCFLWL